MDEANMSELSDAIAVFLHEHQRCGVIASSVEGQYISMACDCGATIMHLLEPGAPMLRSVLDHPPRRTL